MQIECYWCGSHRLIDDPDTVDDLQCTRCGNFGDWDET